MSARVELDQVRCIVSGTCEMVAPGVFEIDDDSVVQVLQPEPTGELLALARKAAEACPSRAIALLGDKREDQRGS